MRTVFGMKLGRILGLMLIVLLLVTQIPCALATEYLPMEIKGNSSGFSFNTRTGKMTVPDCIVLEAHAFNTKWDIDDAFYESGTCAILFNDLMQAKVMEMPKQSSGKYDRYEYAGLEFFVQSTRDSAVSARLRMYPRNKDDYPEYLDLVDLEIVLYHNYGQPNEDFVLREYLLESYGLWNGIVRYTMEYYEPADLKNTVSIEYHSLQNDPGAPATPSLNPPVLRKKSQIQAITKILMQSEKLDTNMAGVDYMHLRFVDEKGKRMNVYLQEPSNDSRDKIYARMGAYCYRVDKQALQKALNDAGIPWEMMIG